MQSHWAADCLLGVLTLLFSAPSGMKHFTHFCVRVRNRYVHIASRRADFARSGGSRWIAINHLTCHSVCYSNIAGCFGLMRIIYNFIFFALIIHETKHHALQSLLDYLSVILSVIFCPIRKNNLP
ncbi:hypothetical protein T05_1450 [Trichinella murrelli]|uniref:Secreted protein n=1 Tax=Trichinella murrelli TaxID=144512 RepID=A0A0V0UJW0_9BILA|nr:hypothetical protein T05_1450 [Trichinella murrelli]